MIQAKVFFDIDSLNDWLRKNEDKFDFVKFFSRSPKYFFVVYKDIP